MNKAVIDLCKKVVEDNLNINREDCREIDCSFEDCPFADGWLCILDYPERRLKVAKEYLKDNGIKEESKMKEKTFREVIADIKVGEVWEITKGNNIEISLSKNGVTLDFKKSIECEKIFFPNDTKFKLKSEEYTFEEAFKAYEEGEVVESEDGFIYKKINGQDCVCSDETRDWVKNDGGFSVKEIRGKWYIND